MKKSISLLAVIALLMIVNQSLSAQEKDVAAKLFYAELCGPGIVMSANFDSRFKPNSKIGFGYRVGVGFGVEKFEDKLGEILNDGNFSSYNEGVTGPFYSVPIGLNYLFGKPRRISAFEVGAGVTFLSHKVSLYNYDFDKPGHLIGYLTIMYRLMPVYGGLSLRIGITPIIGTAGDFFPTGALSLGYAF